MSTTTTVAKKDAFSVNAVEVKWEKKDVREVVNNLLAVKTNATQFNKVQARTNVMLYTILADIYQIELNINTLVGAEKKQLVDAIKVELKKKGYKPQSTSTLTNLILKFTFSEKLDRRRIYDYEQAIKLASTKGWEVADFANEIKAIGGVTEAEHALKGKTKVTKNALVTTEETGAYFDSHLFASFTLAEGIAEVDLIEGTDVAVFAVKKQSNSLYTIISPLVKPKAEWLNDSVKKFASLKGNEKSKETMKAENALLDLAAKSAKSKTKEAQNDAEYAKVA